MLLTWQPDYSDFMPNTLVHLGVQALGTRLIAPTIDLKWVVLGSVLPDLPWILRRFIRASIENLDIYDLHLYSTVQASLAFCLLLSLVFALLSTKPKLVFIVLALNCILHLLLDSLEIKWGNGVNFLAPFSWQFLSFELLWPDSTIMLVLSVVGFVIIALYALAPVSDAIRVSISNGRRLMLATFFLALYCIAPTALLNGPYGSNINSVAVLINADDRVGKELLMDREQYIRHEHQDIVLSLANEPLRIIGGVRAESGSTVSLVATFVERDAIEIQQLHVFHNHWRDAASYLGLAIAGFYWIVRMLREV